MLTESQGNLVCWGAGVCSWQALKGRKEEVLWYKPLVWGRTMSLRTLALSQVTAVYICNGLADGLWWDMWTGQREKHPGKLEKGRSHPHILKDWVHTEAVWAGMAWNDMTGLSLYRFLSGWTYVSAFSSPLKAQFRQWEVAKLHFASQLQQDLHFKNALLIFYLPAAVSSCLGIGIKHLLSV